MEARKNWLRRLPCFVLLTWTLFTDFRGAGWNRPSNAVLVYRPMRSSPLAGVSMQCALLGLGSVYHHMTTV
eukprot:1059926-Amphidinium_carterae.1